MGCLILAILLMATATAPARADYDAGLSAAERGDFATALREWEPLAEQGHARAQTDLGYMHASGHGVPRDDARAVQLYRLAAEQALPRAQFNLGYMYMHGRGVERDYAEGLRWYRRAAGLGFVGAQFNLGVRHYTGEGTERDLGEAYFWLTLAKRAGHGRAHWTLEDVEKLLSDEERLAASERLKSWKPAESDLPLPEVAAERPRAAPTLAAIEPPPQDGAGEVSLIQLGSLRSRDSALREWDRLKGPHSDLLGPLGPQIQKVDVGAGRGVFYRLRAGSVAGRAAAERLCADLNARKVQCLPVEPDGEVH